MISPYSLESRRPRCLRDFVGSPNVVTRLSKQMSNGSVPRRAFIFGPTGSGKTTLGEILARHYYCENRIGKGDVCLICPNCLGESKSNYHHFTGAQMSERWSWFEDHFQTLSNLDSMTLFLDEAQDLHLLHQKSLFRILERATANVIFATTHKQAINDALASRFGANIYELCRPPVSEVVSYLKQLMPCLGVMATDAVLERMIKLNDANMRSCVDFIYTAVEQTSDKVITDAFIDMVFGVHCDHASRTDTYEVQRVDF